MLIKSKSFALFMASASLAAILSTPVSAMDDDDVEMGCCGLKKATAHYAAKKSEDDILSAVAHETKYNVTTKIQRAITPEPIRIQCNSRPLVLESTRVIDQGLQELTDCVIDYTLDEARKGTAFKAGAVFTEFIEQLPENGLSKLKVETELLLNKHIS